MTDGYTLKNAAKNLFLNHGSRNYDCPHPHENCLGEGNLLAKVEAGLKSDFEVPRESGDFLLGLYVEVKQLALALIPDHYDIFAFVVFFGTLESPNQSNV